MLFQATVAELGTVADILRSAGIKVDEDPAEVPPDGIIERVRNAVRGDSFPVQLEIPVPSEYQAAVQGKCVAGTGGGSLAKRANAVAIRAKGA